MPGNPLVSTIDLIGDVVWDTHLAVPHFPTPEAEARATSRRRLLGGTAGHVARWLHLLEQAGLYASAAPLIRLWTTMDRSAAQELAFCDLSSCRFVEQGTEVFILTRPDGEKAMMSYVPPDLPPRPLPSRSALFYLSAYALFTADPIRQIIEPCERLLAKGAQMVFDLAPLVQQMERQQVLRLVKQARIATGNDAEWQQVFFTAKSPQERARAALALGAGMVHLKRGAKGSLVLWGSGGGIELAAPPTRAISTAGAGDAATAALLACLTAGRDERFAARLAGYCGTLHTEQRRDEENIQRLRKVLTTLASGY